MSVERLHFAPGRMAYNSMTAAEHVCRYGFAAPLCRGRRVLDLACGEGYGSAFLAEAGAAHVLGVDVSEAAIAAAREGFARPGVAFRAGDAGDLSRLLADEAPFDVVVSFETIEHVAEVRPFLEGIRAALAPGGVVLISAPNEITAHGVSANPFHLRAYTIDTFLAETEAVLGPARQVWIGAPIIGFGILQADGALAGNDAAELAAMTRGAAAGPSWVLPAQREHRVDARNASFFVAAWGGEAAMALTAAPVSHPAWIEQYEALQWLRLENARLLRAADAARPAPPSPAADGGHLAEALADLRRAALLERQRLEQALADLEAGRAAAQSLRVNHNALGQRFAALRDHHAGMRDQRDAARRQLAGLQPFVAALRDQRDAALRGLAAMRSELARLRAEAQARQKAAAAPAVPDAREAALAAREAAVAAREAALAAIMPAPAPSSAGDGPPR